MVVVWFVVAVALASAAGLMVWFVVVDAVVVACAVVAAVVVAVAVAFVGVGAVGDALVVALAAAFTFAVVDVVIDLGLHLAARWPDTTLAHLDHGLRVELAHRWLVQVCRWLEVVGVRPQEIGAALASVGHRWDAWPPPGDGVRRMRCGAPQSGPGR